MTETLLECITFTSSNGGNDIGDSERFTLLGAVGYSLIEGGYT